MSVWYSKSLGDGVMAWEPLGRIEALFRTEYAKAGMPDDMALFIRHESEGRLHCEVSIYLSPAAVAVAKAVDARPCGTPSRDGLSLVVGAHASWSALFP